VTAVLNVLVVLAAVALVPAAVYTVLGLHAAAEPDEERAS